MATQANYKIISLPLLRRPVQYSPSSFPPPGLDSASSLEILKSLQEMAGTGRAVVVTIHQPRSEIFHAFDKILLLCKGQVAFFGSPVKVWEFFRKALIMEKELEVCLCGSCDAVGRSR